MENQTGLEELQTALVLDPNSVAANTFMALYWSRKNKYDLALRAIHAALLLDPKNPALQVELGNILAASGDSPGAYQAFQQAVALSPNDPSYLCSLARFSLSYEFEVSGVALPAARRAVVLAPKLPESQDTLAQVMIRLGDLDSAARFVWRALQADPDYPPAHLHLGLIYALRGEQGAAYQELTLASSLAPGSATSDQALRLLQTYFP
jgi:Flp pilus assembly protein TadD